MTNEINTKYNKNNEIIKYQFFKELTHSGKKDNEEPRDQKTVLQYVNAIHEFEVATNFKDFKKFNQDLAILFKDYLSDKKSKVTKDHISKSLYVHYLKYVKEFFEWLVANNNEYSHIKKSDINFFKSSQNDKNTALSTKFQESYLISEILSTIRRMPASTENEMRDKAMLSLAFLTTPRISALQTCRMQSIKFFKEYDTWAFEQDPKLVTTKKRKYILSFFIGNVQDIVDNVINWQKYLTEKGFKNKDYLFPQINSSFTIDGKPTFTLSKNKINSDSWIRQNVFKKSFEKNSLKYINPHNFRHTMARAMKKLPNGVDLSIALAENDGQKNGMSVLHSSYGGDYNNDRAKLMKGFILE